MHEGVKDFVAGVVTVSTSRFERYGFIEGIENIPEDDESGRIIAEVFGEKAGFYKLIPDDIQEIRKTVYEFDGDVLVITGGTGLSPSDVTVEALDPIFEKKIEGFGEIFRAESYREIGYNAILSRAIAGIIDGKIIFCLPGSKNAVKLGMKIIKEIAGHVLAHAKGER